MTAVNKINSNSTGLAYAKEASPKTLPGSPVWVSLEPNDYKDFGANVKTSARNPINADRQNKKGAVVDLDASGGFSTDWTYTNMQDLLQGFFFAAFRNKGDAKNALGVTALTFSVATLNSRFTRMGGALDLTTLFAINDLVCVRGSAYSANNGLFKVSAIAATTLDVVKADGASTAVVLADEAATPNISIVKVGVESAIGDVDVDVTGTYPALTSTALNFTTLGLVVGEFIFVGGDAATCKFTNAVNSGFARVRSVAAGRVEFDKTQFTWVDETNTTKLVHLYLGRVLKNETGANIVQSTYQLERTLGKPDTTSVNNQSEVLTGAVPNELTINVPQAEKVTMDLGFVAMNHETRTSTEGPKATATVAPAETDMFNTSSDFSRIKMALVGTNANPTALFAYGTDMSLVINNGIEPDKAVGVFGAFDVSIGNFMVNGKVTAYFTDVAMLKAMKAGSAVTLDMHMVKNNRGISIDLPCLTLGEGRVTVEANKPVTLPLSHEAASGAYVHTNLNHTMLMNFFDYLPDLAEA